MGEYSAVSAKLSDIQPGVMVAVNVNGIEILLANVGGTLHAISNICTHMGGRLSKGKLNGSIVTCPLHGSQFDITTGKNIRWMQGKGFLYSIGKIVKSPVDIKTYNVKLEGQQILVEI